jgi:hypothetical protein
VGNVPLFTSAAVIDALSVYRPFTVNAAVVAGIADKRDTTKPLLQWIDTVAVTVRAGDIGDLVAATAGGLGGKVSTGLALPVVA